MNALLRQYERWECLGDGYPEAWHRSTAYGSYPAGHSLANPAIKNLIRGQAGHRCLRCGHPYPPGVAETHPRGEWTPCDIGCSHGGPTRRLEDGVWVEYPEAGMDGHVSPVEANYRILTVHHLDEDKANCRWWNLLAACQRCHLSLQRRVVMGRPYHYEHKDYFKPYAAGFYAWKYLQEELSREETMARLAELLILEHRFTQETLV